MRWLVAIAVALAAAACTPRERTTELREISPYSGYRHGVLETIRPKTLPRTFVVMSFSGGGTRAAALAHGALKALAETSIPAGTQPVLLADEIDMISSVSGGSVTAAHFALRGRQGMATFEADFLKHNVQRDLILAALNPLTWARLSTPAYARIDVLRDYFDERVFGGRTYADMLAPLPSGRRPYLVLNAADMATGSVFSFTQDQFDLLCSDLAKLTLADAVAASAAFPVAFTALTLKNRSPCAAQRAAVGRPETAWRDVGGHPRPLRVINDVAAKNNPGRFRRGRTALSYLNEEGTSAYVHLLDGGIADNLGLTEPLTMLTGLDRAPSIRARINRGLIDHLVLIVVNARSESDTRYGSRATPPGILATLSTTIGTPIDSTSFLLVEHLDAIVNDEDGDAGKLQKTIVAVDFDFIEDAACRRRFKSMATSWLLSEAEIDALVALGNAMVRNAPRYRELVAALGGSVAPEGPTIDKACVLATQGDG